MFLILLNSNQNQHATEHTSNLKEFSITKQIFSFCNTDPSNVKVLTVTNI